MSALEENEEKSSALDDALEGPMETGLEEDLAADKDDDPLFLVPQEGMHLLDEFKSNPRGNKFSLEVEKAVAMQSELVKTMWEGDRGADQIPLPNVKQRTLSKVGEFMVYHHNNPSKEIEKPLKSANMHEVVPEWDANFVETDQETLFELILAANYMDIKPLLDLTCAKVASMIKGKTPEEIRKRFNIQNDFTPEEEEAVRAENKWAEES